MTRYRTATKLSKLLLALTVSTSLFATSVQAQQLCPSGTVVLFVNGIANDADDANLGMNSLRALVNLTTTPGGRTIDYRVRHNPTDGFTNDFRETIIQWINQNAADRNNVRNSMERLRAAVMNGQLDVLLALLQTSTDPSVRLTATTAAALRQWLISEMSNLIAAHGRTVHARQLVLGDLNDAIDRGNRVVLVTHSQGNFVGNEAVDSLASDKRGFVSMVSVATPANRVAGSDGVHFTLTRDFIGSVPGRLAPNLPQPIPCVFDPILNHSFSGCYMNWAGVTARSQIRSAILPRLDRPLPSGIIANGVVVGTLRWGAQPDVDLHAFEPSGAHVYYASRSGPTATLDRDDVTSYGPENIYVCEDPAVGNYRFGVNYYYGTGPETANVQLKAGGVSRQMPSIGLAASRGSSGNASPIPAGTVVVTRDSEGRLSYRIQ